MRTSLSRRAGSRRAVSSRAVSLATASLAAALVLTGCSSNAQESESAGGSELARSVEHARGTVEVPEPDLEAIAELQPDLILGTDSRHSKLY